MRKIFIVFLVCFCLGGFFPWANAEARQLDYLPSFWPGGEMYPKAILMETSHDFGEVKPGTQVKYDFKVQNQGDGPLIIQRVTPG